MRLPFLGVEVEIENTEVVDYKITTTHDINKKLLFKEVGGTDKNCNLRCGKDVCDGSCANKITMTDIENGTLQVMYIR